MPKSPDAFRTISEVADWLGIQAHVLRFWESKFTQVKPIKRAGGRRYYRPNDMLLLGGIKKLLHDDGLTIKGVQKILREEGMNHVSAMSVPLDDVALSEMEKSPAKPEPKAAPMLEDAEPETGVVLPFGSGSEPQEDIKAEPETAETELKSEGPTVEDPTPDAAAPPNEETILGAAPSDDEAPAEMLADAPDPVDEPAAPAAEESAVEPDADLAPDAAQHPTDSTDTATTHATSEPDPTPEPEGTTTDPAPEPEAEPEDAAPAGEAPAEDPQMEPLPAFLRHPADADAAPDAEDPASTAEPEVASDNMPPEPEAVEMEEAAAPRARDIGMPDVTPEAQIHAVPGALAAALRQSQLSRAQVEQIRPLLSRLAALRDSMSAQRPPSAKD